MPWYWETKFIRIEPSSNEEPSIKIDEIVIIINQNKILWMLGMIDCAGKEAKVFGIMNNGKIYFEL